MWRQFRRTIPLHLDDPITCGNSSTRRYHYIWMTPLHVETVPHDNTITCGDSSTWQYHYMWRQFHRTTPLHVDTAPQDDTITYGGPQFLRREFHGTLPFHVDDPHDMWRDFHGTMPLSVDDPISLAGSSGGFEPSLWSWPWKQQSNFLHKALLLMMMYHPIIFGWKKISSSADMVKTVISDQTNPHCDP